MREKAVTPNLSVKMKIKSRQQLVNEIAEALDMRLEEGFFYLNLTEQEVGLNLPSEYVDED